MSRIRRPWPETSGHFARPTSRTSRRQFADLRSFCRGSLAQRLCWV